MFTSDSRRIEHEILDDLPSGEGDRSLRDLTRINQILGGHETTRQALRSLPLPPKFTLLDVGAATGDMARVIHRAFPESIVTSLDYRIEHVHRAPTPRLVGDAFHMPFAQASFDVVHCSLFLHHFSDGQVVELLRNFAAVARIGVVVNDLERHILPYLFLPATKWIFGWDRVTLHDGPISVQAAFTPAELKSLARKAGLKDVKVHARRPAFRIGLTALR